MIGHAGTASPAAGSAAVWQEDPFQWRNLAGSRPELLRQSAQEKLEPWLRRTRDPLAFGNYLGDNSSYDPNAVARFCLPAFAQVDTSLIAGTVKDSSGALIAGATVHFVREATGVEVTSTTGAAGEYVSPPLHPGDAQKIDPISRPQFRSVP
jgi:hypothetical protein